MTRILTLGFLMLFSLHSVFATQYYVDEATGDDLFDGLFAVPGANPNGPKKTISAAIAAASAFDTINVAPGVYAEVLIINKQLTLFGAHFGNRPFTDNRGSESIIIPPFTNNSNTFPPSSNSLIRLESNDIIIDGFTINGDNPAMVSGDLLNGVDVNIAYGITDSTNNNGIIIQNNIILNFFADGIRLQGKGIVSSDKCSINSNYFDNISNAANAANAVNLIKNFYADVKDNFFRRVFIGIQTFDFNLAGKTSVINNNDIESFNTSVKMMFHRQNASRYIVDNNHFMKTPGSTINTGLGIFSVKDTCKINISNNSIEKSQIGYYFWEVPTSNTLEINGGNTDSCTHGVYLSNYDDVQLAASAASNVILKNVSLFNSESTAIYVRDRMLGTNNVTITCQTGVFISGGLDGAQLQGSKAFITLTNTAFNTIARNYIFLRSNSAFNFPTTNVNATLCTFDGKTGAAMTQAEGFATEDKILHKLDTAFAGLVTFKPTHLFITGNTGNDTIGTALPLTADGWVVNILNGNYLEDITVDKSITFAQSGTVSVNSLNMNGAGKTLTLIGDLNVNNQLNLTQGLINTTVGNHIIVADGAFVGGGNPNSYVNGPLTLDLATTGGFSLDYPIGKGPDFRPVSLNVDQTSAINTSYTAELENAPAPANALPGTLDRVSKVHYWNIQKSAGSAINNASINLTYDTLVNNDFVLDDANLRIAKTDGAGNWVDLDGTGTANGAGDISSLNAFNTLGVFTLANATGGGNPLASPNPKAGFTFANLCVSDSVSFTDTSKADLGVINRWFWDFGVAAATDDTSNLQHPKFKYATGGTYNVKLVIYTDLGFKDSVTKSVTLLPNPVSDFSFAGLCTSDSTSFTDGSSVIGDVIVKWEWDFGDGNSSLDQNPKHKYAADGLYSVTLKVTSTPGCTNQLTQNVNISNGPTSDFTAAIACNADTTQFVDLSTVSGDVIVDWSWDFGDGNTSLDQNPKHKYAAPGPYNVVLLVTSSNGCTSGLLKQINIIDKPAADFSFSNACFSDSVQMVDNSIASFGDNIIDWQWDFGDGNFSNIQNPKHKYAVIGQYFVNLKVTSLNGCEDTLTLPITLNIKPVSAFSFATACLSDSVRFTDLSTSTLPSTIVNWDWDFGDGNISALPNPGNLFAAAGTYQVMLKVTTNEGCQDTSSQSITVNPLPSATITPAGVVTICANDSITFSVPAGAASYSWSTGATTPSIKANTAGGYFVTVTDSSGCSASDTVILNTHPVVIADAGSDTTINKGNSVQLSGFGGDTYSWTPAATLNDSSIQAPVATPEKTITYLLTVTDTVTGCTGTDTVRITVIQPTAGRINNLFTPNGDGENDTWDLSDIPNLNACEVTVINRWGKEVFTAKPYMNNWDGTKDGENLPEGVYYYVIKCDGTDPIKGAVHIMR